ncbi:heparinase II/III family protein, partial [Beijerinckia sp. L45]|uniref:heparinase II/III family protein n=1 Tax=Beijerinckia sp. L45 TaxID=1641855 RepID=UPI0015763475
CAPGSEAFQRQGTERLAAELKLQILADGGHVSRNPQQLIDLLLDLLPLRQAYAARGIQIPASVLNAIDRMMPMLRLFRHGDGTMALFNGMGLTAPELVATILAYDDARAQPLTNATYSGYQRMEAGRSVVIIDAGAIPPQAFSTQAHAGCLSFEFSNGFQRLVVNCGAPEVSRANAREAARATAAHSTLVVDDTSSCRFAAHAGLQKWLNDEILSGPRTVAVDRQQSGGFTTVKTSHDGYASRFGLTHARELSLADDGASLEGRDALEDAGKTKPGVAPYALRFHLHPRVRAQVVGDDTAVLLDLPDGDRWLFQADAPLVLEPSVVFATSGGPRPTLQIRITGDSATRGAVHWAFRRRPAAATRPLPDAPIVGTEETEQSAV